MNRVIVFGSTGHLGQKILEALRQRGIFACAVVRNADRAVPVKGLANEVSIAEVTNPASLRGICKGYDTVISALGKSVSLNDRSKPSFEDVDLKANASILDEAVKTGVKKFVYVSALHAERYPHLTYFGTHHQFSERLKASGIDYSIVKPPALFSAFLDLVEMARKGQLVTLGKGDKRTNPIFEGDLAKICVEAIEKPNAEIEAGGKEIFTRRQINELIQAMAAPTKKVRSLPLGLVKPLLPPLKLFSKNTYDKFAFFLAVLQDDVLAPQTGSTSLKDYLAQLLQKNLSAQR